MKLTKEIAQLIIELEYLIGSRCENPNSYNGYSRSYGKDFRYPVCVKYDNSTYKVRGMVKSLKKPELIRTMKYKFGSNHLLIGEGLESVLGLLEERYHLDFNELEKKRLKNL